MIDIPATSSPAALHLYRRSSKGQAGGTQAHACAWFQTNKRAKIMEQQSAVALKELARRMQLRFEPGFPDEDASKPEK